ncbi:MAG: glycosyltransferase, partial [Pseudobutyrivibrio sp.]|nr:glycosyltransferase [Pseudobutyrivibrio sp.]
KELYISSYFAAKRFVVDEMLNYKGAYPYVMGLVLRTTKSICNVNVNHRDRMEGVSGYSIRKLIALWMNGFTAFSILPLRVASYGGALIATVGFIMAIAIVVMKFILDYRVLGWTSMMAVQLLLGGLILLVLGLIGEYIGRIYLSINNSPQYVIKEVVGLDTNNKEE